MLTFKHAYRTGRLSNTWKMKDKKPELRSAPEHPSLFPTVQSTALSVVRMSKMKEAHQHVNKSITKENKVITVTEVQEKRGA